MPGAPSFAEWSTWPWARQGAGDRAGRVSRPRRRAGGDARPGGPGARGGDPRAVSHLLRRARAGRAAPGGRAASDRLHNRPRSPRQARRRPSRPSRAATEAGGGRHPRVQHDDGAGCLSKPGGHVEQRRTSGLDRDGSSWWAPVGDIDAGRSVGVHGAHGPQRVKPRGRAGGAGRRGRCGAGPDAGLP